MSHIFISYSHQDSDYARKLAKNLAQQGFAVWIDENINYGDRWFRMITQAIRDSSSVAVIMTPEAEQSEWVEKEILLAQSEKKSIFPLLLKGHQLPLLITTQYVDVTDGNLPPQRFYEMVAKVTPPNIAASNIEAKSSEKNNATSTIKSELEEKNQVTAPQLKEKVQLIYITYSHRNRKLVEIVANDLQELGYQVWFDQNLMGEQRWWDQILEQIRQCDLFIYALSPEALAAETCQLEYKYAYQLNKSILPLLASSINSYDMPPELSRLQWIDYRNQDKEAAIYLMSGLSYYSVLKPLPNPLPEPPALPISPLVRLKEEIVSLKRQIDAPGFFNFSEQLSIVAKLQTHLQNDDISEDDFLDLLKKMQQRPDLIRYVNDEIVKLLNNRN